MADNGRCDPDLQTSKLRLRGRAACRPAGTAPPPHWATLAGPVNEGDPGARGAVRSDAESHSFAPCLANRAGAPRPAPAPPPPRPAAPAGAQAARPALPAGAASHRLGARPQLLQPRLRRPSCLHPAPHLYASRPHGPSQPGPHLYPGVPHPRSLPGLPHLYPNRRLRPPQLAPHTRDPCFTHRPAHLVAAPLPTRGPAPGPPSGLQASVPGAVGLDSDPGSGARAGRRPRRKMESPPPERPWDLSLSGRLRGSCPLNIEPAPSAGRPVRPCPLASPPPPATTLLPARPSPQPGKALLGLRRLPAPLPGQHPTPQDAPSRDLSSPDS